MVKIWAIAQKQLLTTFRDRNVVLLIVGIPLGVSVIVAMAFGGGVGGLEIRDIPVAVVNLDEGTEQQGQSINYGDTLTSLLVDGDAGGGGIGDIDCGPSDDNEDTADPNSEDDTNAQSGSLEDLLEGAELEDAAAARTAVDEGEYTVAVIIPASYSADLTVDADALLDEGSSDAGMPQLAEIEIYVSSSNPLYGSIIYSIVQGYNNQILTGNIAISSSIGTLVEQQPMAAAALGLNTNDEDINKAFGCAFSGALGTIDIDAQTVAAGEAPRISLTAFILVQVGAAQAAFMAMFTGMFGALSIHEEQREWTMQRLLVSPTPRIHILLGKLLGTFITVVFQLTVVFVTLTLIASFIEGGFVLIWGTELLPIILVVLAMAVATSGVGILIGGAARSPEQAGSIGPVFLIILSLLGGAFGFMPPQEVAQFSLVFQGSDAFIKLSQGNTDIFLNVFWLVLQGAVLFGIGMWLFNRRMQDT